MKVSYFHLDPRPAETFQVTAAKYEPEHPAADGLVLLLAHANGTHKETWEPLLDFLFALQNASGGKAIKVKEAWSFEYPNHGTSALLNEREIHQKYPNLTWSGWIYPRAMLSFIQSDKFKMHFEGKNLVGIGHSHGGNSLVLLDYLTQSIKFQAFILLDPTLGLQSEEKNRMHRILTQITWNKRDTWPSREIALLDLAQQPGYRNWHPKTLQIFVEKGLNDHPALNLEDPWKFNGVMLSCTRANEAAANNANDHHEFAFDHLQSLYKAQQPIYLIHSKTDEFKGKKLKADQIDSETVKRLGSISVQYIEKGGHMFVQTCPEETAHAIWNVLMHFRQTRLNSAHL